MEAKVKQNLTLFDERKVGAKVAQNPVFDALAGEQNGYKSATKSEVHWKLSTLIESEYFQGFDGVRDTTKPPQRDHDRPAPKLH